MTGGEMRGLRVASALRVGLYALSIVAAAGIGLLGLAGLGVAIAALITAGVIGLAVVRPAANLALVVILGPLLNVGRAYAVALGVPSVLPTLLPDAVIIITLAVTILRALHSRVPVKPSPIDISLIALVLLQGPMVLAAGDLRIGLIGLRVAFDGILGFFLVRLIRPSDSRLLLGAILASGVMVALTGLLQWAAGPEATRVYVEDILHSGLQILNTGIVRIPTVLGSANTASWLFVLGLVIAAGSYANASGRGRRALAAFSGVLLLMGLTLTLVRAAGVELAVSAVAAATLARGRTRTRIVLGAIAGIFMVGTLLLLVAPQNVRDSVFQPTQAYDQLRYASWQASARKLLANPIGYGLGTQGAQSLRFEQEGLPISAGEGDNWYLKQALESGVATVIVFVFSQILIIRTGINTIRRSTPSLMALGLTSAMIGFGLVNVFSNAWDWFPANLCYWIVAGLLVNMCLRRNTPASHTLVG
jgi:hypothetical protein